MRSYTADMLALSQAMRPLTREWAHAEAQVVDYGFGPCLRNERVFVAAVEEAVAADGRRWQAEKKAEHVCPAPFFRAWKARMRLDAGRTLMAVRAETSRERTPEVGDEIIAAYEACDCANARMFSSIFCCKRCKNKHRCGTEIRHAGHKQQGLQRKERAMARTRKGEC